jgi:hypothetical protein
MFTLLGQLIFSSRIGVIRIGNIETQQPRHGLITKVDSTTQEEAGFVLV